ncbi:TetR/AcrR family transcriptional regulator [Nocardioides bizhenqiangii]|uniref:Helix-turn-helix domain-containing protein n=1 Tax=Nocardioides bizhenqiangii TaxID=3095076 RepID=A0ABZ0ZRT4_9ACTN|nr:MULTISPECIES: helix-turn-helix domain-containing protein [unclassified Nocardioides]MDZ5619811.1 helix-turn-helix domain-containing protein [Nocardioides sp. HM23]WQQ26183.1 helix-turn-helix domain-containing protein [Nocardioides sp. HM61]
MTVKRSYSSAKRDAQARATRRSILDAARDLFVTTGYTATTIQAIAERAGVAVQTVYAVFGNKRELLRQLIESTIAGADEPVEMTNRPEAQAVAAEPDPRRRAELDAALARSIMERVAPILRVTAEAAASDPELAAMMHAVKMARREEMVTAAAMLAGADGLRTTQEEAEATLYVLYSPHVADMLIGDYGWSPERYEKWLSRMLLQSVIQ